jgi:predicted transcriptional regulator
MARKPSPTLTEAETRLMNVLWSKDRATVAEVAAAMAQNRPVAYNTVQTTLRILERKGYVAHGQKGRAFVYHPIVQRSAARRRALGYLTKALFDGSPGLLVRNVLENGRIEPAELEHLKRLINES